jgi:hypothetical protein
MHKAIYPGHGTLSLLKSRIQECIEDETAYLAETRVLNFESPLDPLRTTKAQNIEAYTTFKEDLTFKWTTIDERVFARVRYAPQEGLTNDQRVAIPYETLAIEERRA